MIGIGIIIGLWIIEYRARSFSIAPRVIDTALWWIFVPAVVGARVYHLITDWHLYAEGSLVDMIALWHGGLGIYGALFGGVLGLLAFAYARREGLPQSSLATRFFFIADLYVFGIPIGQAIGRIGNFINQELYGMETSLPWGIEVDGVRYHPLFAYEAIALTLLSALLHWFATKKSFVLGKGQYTAIYFAGYGSIRFWLEFLRIDSARLDGQLQLFTIAQWVSLVLVLFAAVVFWTRRHAVGVKKIKEWDFSLE